VTIFATSSLAHLRNRFDPQGIPDKGKLLTSISLFWFDKLKDIVPNHLVTVNIDEMPEEVKEYRDQLEGRTMLVKKAKVIPLEAIVRGYLTGAMHTQVRQIGTHTTRFVRLSVGGIQEIWHHARNSLEGGHGGIREVGGTSRHPIDQSRAGST
jgi:phosphoribosylaminoimidazole-succinocarboxamide synthase